MHIRYFWPFLIWFGIILYLSFTPLNSWPQPTIFQKLYIDKAVHIFMYGVLSFLLLRSFFFRQKKQYPHGPIVAGALFFCVATGVTIEFLQPVLTMFRKFEWMDMVANAAGAIVGWTIFRWMVKRRWMGLKGNSAV